MSALLILAWGFALFNVGRILATEPLDLFGLVINAAVLLGAPVIGVLASREAPR